MSFNRFAAAVLCLTVLLCAIDRHAVNAQTLDKTFNTNFKQLNFDGVIRDVVFLPDNKMMLAGDFPYIDDTRVYGLARLNADGSVDKTFANLGPVDASQEKIAKIAVQPDGKVLVAGVFRERTTKTVIRGVYRYNTDGSLDAGFRTTLPDNCSSEAMVLQPDGKIVISVSYQNTNGPWKYGVVRLNADGSQDNTFQCALLSEQSILDLALEPDGQVVVAGGLASGISTALIKRYNADGSPDAAFNENAQVTDIDPYANVSNIDLLPDGSFLISGRFEHCNGVARDGMAKIDADGRVIAGFVPGYTRQTGMFHQAVRANGNIVVCASALESRVGGQRLFSVLLELNPDGSVYNTFPGLSDQTDGAMAWINGAYVAPDGKYILKCNGDVAGVPVRGITRISPDGTFDHSFRLRSGTNYTTSAAVYDFVVQPDKKIIVIGDFNFVNNLSRNYVARLKYDGSVDETFDPGTGLSGRPRDVLLQPDGKILVAGDFLFANQKLRKGLVRFHPDGRVDEGFQVSFAPYTEVFAIARQPDGKVIVKGVFPNYGTGIRLIRLNTDGTPDVTFAPAELEYIMIAKPPTADDYFYPTMYPIAVQPDGKIVTEHFRFNADGTPDASFTPSSRSYFVALLPDGKMLMRGLEDHNLFTGLCRVQANGALDIAFDPITAEDYFTAVYVQPDGRIVTSKQYNGITTTPIYTRRLTREGQVDPTFYEGVETNRIVQPERRTIGMHDDDLILMAGFKAGSNGPIERIKIDTRSAQQITATGLPAVWDFNGEAEAIALPTTSTAGLPLTYEVVSGPATVTGNMLTIQGTGTVEVRLLQTGNAVYYAATPVVYRVISARRQTIDFTAPADHVFTGAPAAVTLTATASSGLTVTFNVVAGPATVAGNILTITGTGAISVRARQPGDTEYFAADSVVRVFSSRRQQTITFDAVVPMPVSDGSQMLTAATTSGLPVSLSVVAGGASVNGSTLTLKAAGPVTVQAKQAGNDHYLPAEPVEQTFCINPDAPRVTIHTSSLTAMGTGSFQWFRNGDEIEGAVNASIDIDAPGAYTVQVTVDGCTSDFSMGVTVTDVIEESASSVVVFPNPATNRLFIQADHLPPATRVSLYSLDGVELYSQPLSALHDGHLAVGALPRGIYVLIFTHAGDTHRMTVVLE
ncbi:T9SS type A sorting domain-containing protein [Fulvivirgaceae bacterium PWU5]|uniref:T9SS type A sorting domain-containing protein n=1 Tax=Dawidia cretensis TaxID=2782350 RepID=A0AAP2GWD0_9BACT|nr:T9SS type A sorting domain-containing protein [Dawidia cretensis]MBT1712170.1 T9SS type A sorting domain-containing protein [Dawidia cretensis]